MARKVVRKGHYIILHQKLHSVAHQTEDVDDNFLGDRGKLWTVHVCWDARVEQRLLQRSLHFLKQHVTPVGRDANSVELQHVRMVLQLDVPPELVQERNLVNLVHIVRYHMHLSRHINSLTLQSSLQNVTVLARADHVVDLQAQKLPPVLLPTL